MTDDELIEAMLAASDYDALSAELAALRIENDALRAERDENERGWQRTYDHDVALLKARAEKAEANYRFMVERAADEKLDGYREMGSKCAALEERAEKAEAERDDALVAVKAMHKQRYELTDVSKPYMPHYQMEPDESGDYVLYADHEAELEALRSENHALKAEREKLLGCRDELREIAEAISDPRIHNTMTIAEWCREASALTSAPSDLSLTGLSAFNDVLGHNYWMEATTFAGLRRRIVEHWQRSALGD